MTGPGPACQTERLPFVTYGHASFLHWHDAILDYDEVAHLLAEDDSDSCTEREVDVKLDPGREAPSPRQQADHDD